MIIVRCLICNETYELNDFFDLHEHALNPDSKPSWVCVEKGSFEQEEAHAKLVEQLADVIH